MLILSLYHFNFYYSRTFITKCTFITKYVISDKNIHLNTILNKKKKKLSSIIVIS